MKQHWTVGAPHYLLFFLVILLMTTMTLVAMLFFIPFVILKAIYVLAIAPLVGRRQAPSQGG